MFTPKIRLNPELRQILNDLEKIQTISMGTAETLEPEERLTMIRFVATNAATKLAEMFREAGR